MRERSAEEQIVNKDIEMVYMNRRRALVALAKQNVPTPEDAEDVVSTSFRKAILKADTFKRKGDDSVYFWIRRIVVNECANFHRDQYRKHATVRLDVQAGESAVEPACSPKFDGINHALNALQKARGIGWEELRLLQLFLCGQSVRQARRETRVGTDKMYRQKRILRKRLAPILAKLSRVYPGFNTGFDPNVIEKCQPSEGEQSHD